MTLARKFGEQLAQPSGWAGRLLGAAMDFANARPLKWSVDLLAPRAGDHLIDAGCGTGAAAIAMMRHADCRVTAIDRSETMLAVARRQTAAAGLKDRCHFQQGDVTAVARKLSGYDGALALNVLYFCDPQSRMIAALHSALRPGGRLVAYVTERSSMESWAFTQTGTHRLFDAAQLRGALVAGGFADEKVCIEAHPIARKVTGLFAFAEA